MKTERRPQMAAIRTDYFGRAAFGKIPGASNMIIIAAAGSIFFILARKPGPPRRSRGLA